MRKRMPAVFTGHGSPMLALDKSAVSESLRQIGQEIVEECGKPQGILAISGHWFTRGTWIQASQEPEQIYDMYGFPEELYRVRYPARGNLRLARETARLLAPDAHLTEDHGVDHGIWTVLIHMFPEADVPVAEMSVDGTILPEKSYELGQKLAPLRDQNILILGSGAIVHNLRQIDPSDTSGSPETNKFRHAVVSHIANKEYEPVIQFQSLPHARYAVPSPEHYLPLLYVLGAAGDEKARVFNDHPQFGSTAITSFVFGLD